MSPNWTEKQVKNLNDYQNCGVYHPFTCGGKKDGKDCRSTLVATKDGWVCPDGCGYTQNWAHDFMLNYDLANDKNPFLRKNDE